MVQLAILGLGCFIISAVFWFFHIHDIKSEYQQYGWASFRTFKQEYSKRQWIYDGYSFYSHDSRCRVNASSISFEGKGMILGYFSYLRFRVWFMKMRYTKRKKPTVKW